MRPSGTEPLVRVMVEAPTAAARRPSTAAERPVVEPPGAPTRVGRLTGRGGRSVPSMAPCAGSSPSSAGPAAGRRPAGGRAARRASSGRSARSTTLTAARPACRSALDAAAVAQLEAADRLLRGTRRGAGPAGRPSPGRRRSPSPPRAGSSHRHRGPRGRPRRRRGLTCRRAELEEFNAALVAPQGRRLGRAARPAAHRPRRRRPRRAASPAARRSTASPSIQQALSALDRLEVRGRDSAGLHLLVSDHGLDLDAPGHRGPMLAERSARRRCSRSGAVRVADGRLASSTRRRPRSASWATTPRPCAQRSATTRCCHRALAAPTVPDGLVLGHTRWASVGIISQANAHPLNSRGARPAADGPTSPAVLNGDVDNFADLKAAEGLAIAAEITTDAKVIPTLVSRRLAAGDARRRRVPPHGRRARGLGGHRRQHRRRARPAPPRPAGQRPGPVRRAGRGRLHRGQRALRPGRGDRHVPPAWTARPRPTRQPEASRARSSCSTPPAPGTLEGIRRAGLRRHRRCRSTAGRPARRPRSPPATSTGATSPTSSSRRSPRRRPRSARRCGASWSSATGELPVTLGPRDAARRPAPAGCGDGRDPPASSSSARARPPWPARAWPRSPPTLAGGLACACEALPATELSGFGAATATWPTRSSSPSASRARPPTPTAPSTWSGPRGATVVAIVNRRNSDLTDKADGVLYTSDGRDVEMSVASTKAFYAQIAAGFLLACALADAAGATGQGRERRPASCSPALRDLPDAMTEAARARGRRSPRPPAQLAPSPPLLGGRGQRVEPDRGRARSGSSSPSSATSRSPATPPRTRSTSTCPPSR